MIEQSAIESLAPEDRKLWEAMGKAKPLYSSMPTPGAPNALEQARFISQMLGTPMMPWQEWAVRVKSEKVPGTPRFRFRTFFETVPRQAGKTTGTRIDLTTKALMSARRRAFYTAQTGKDAAARWNDLAEAIENSPMKKQVTKRRAAGSQCLTFPNGSTISPFAPTPKSLHGYTPHDVVLDEIFAFDALQGDDLMGAIKPAQVTLEDRQLILVSTMGNAKSEFLNGWVDIGRASTLDPTAEVGYIEHALAPGLNAYDPENWDFHPAVGHTITKDDIAEASKILSRGEFERAYMNRRTASAESFVPLDAWDALASELEPVPLADVAVAFDVSYKGDSAAIVGAWYDQTGKIAVKVIASQPGSQWVADYYLENIRPAQPRAFGADFIGETKFVADAIRTAAPSAPFIEIGTRDFATACIGFKNHIMNGDIVHDASPALRSAIEAAEIRPLGEGWAFSRAKSPLPIPELTAAAVAVRLLEANKKTSKPMIYLG